MSPFRYHDEGLAEFRRSHERGVRAEQAEWFQVQFILWRERALVAEASERALRAALSEALEAVRPVPPDPDCVVCGGTGAIGDEGCGNCQ